jgi:hypothetical protein
VSGASISRRLADARPYSYRDDPAVPDFPDDKALIVFDGVCVLCSRLVQFAVKRDPNAEFKLCTAQSEIGQALFRHYGLDTDTRGTQARRGVAARCSVQRLAAADGGLAVRPHCAQTLRLVRPHRPMHDPEAGVARTVSGVSGSAWQ